MTRRHSVLGFSLVIGALSLATAFGAVRDETSDPTNGLIVHEWGTFLAVQGSDGVSLDGVYHEEHALPQFVHARSRDQLMLASARMKGETPVIYFYTNRPQRVAVEVGFPAGIWTQWYPQASLASPSLTGLGSALDLRNGRIAWNVEVLPRIDGAAGPSLPATSADALWNFARDVDAAFVRGTESTRPGPAEYERFIFYRGLGRATLPVEMTHADGGTLKAGRGDADLVQHVFVLRVENGRGAYRYLPLLESGRVVTRALPSMDDALPLFEFSRRIGDELTLRLVESGLYAQEARAMVNTWRASYFQTAGVRVLFVLPQQWTDRFIPLKVQPKPNKVVRVMVGRLEALSPDRERRAEDAVRRLGSPVAATRARAFDYLREQGRYVEPIVRRVLATTRDDSVRTLARRLLLTDFVTELRASLHAAADGSRVAEKPVYVQAQLAGLLRSIGFEDEARYEAGQALAKLATEKAPPLNQHDARHYLRAHARALEASGDDAAAAESFARFIRFGSQVKTMPGCTGCHAGVGGPTEMAWFRDWWAGTKFAHATARAGLSHKSIKDQEAAIAKNPTDVAAQVTLAYLYESIGDRDQASAAWAKLGVANNETSVAAR